MVEQAPAIDVNEEKNHIKVLAAVFLMLLSILLYLIGLFRSRVEYPEYINNYPDINFASMIHPLMIISVFLLMISIYLFIRMRREIFLMSGLILLAIYLWNTNSLIVINPSEYDSYWHFMISQIILDQNQFTSQDITTPTFYLNYPVTGIFSAELAMITNSSNMSIIYYFPLLFSIILISLLFSAARIFFTDSLKASAVAVMVFIIGNASLQTHLAPQPFGLIGFAFLFYILAKYFEKPDLEVKIIMIFLIFIIVVMHPITSFMIALIMVALTINEYAFKKKQISSSMILLFFIFFFAWQIYWAIKTSTQYLIFLSNTFSLIFNEGFFATSGSENITTPYNANIWFISFRLLTHVTFLAMAFMGVMVLIKNHTHKWWRLIGFFLAPFLYSLFVFIVFKSYLYERAIMYMYFPISIAAGYVLYSSDTNPVDSIHRKFRLGFIDSVLKAAVKRIKTYNTQIASVMILILLLFASLNIFAFGLQERGAIVPTEDIEASMFISNHDNESILCFQSNSILYFYNQSSMRIIGQRMGWTYWSEAHLPVSEREIEIKPQSNYIMISKKISDIGIDYDLARQNLENDATLNRVYDNGFIQIYL
jgi:hypothetical protein